MSKETEKKLSELHSKLTDKLLEKIRDPEVKASDLNVARQFLKDNNIGEIDKSSKLILVNGDDKIIWIVGMRLDDRFSINNETKNLLNIEYHK